MSIGHYGWVPDLPDHRDLTYAAPAEFLRALPTMVDLRTQCPPVYDQGQLGSCTGNSIAGAIQFEQIKQKSKNFIPSRLFIYYNERAMENTINSDSGAQIRDGMKVVAKQGAPPETDWPYNITEFTDKPSAVAYKGGQKNRVLSYQRVSRTLSQFKGCLASGYPFVFGFTVYDSFESASVANSGQASMPQPGEQVVGGHAVCAIGYDDKNQWFIVRNSWGPDWGMSGYFTLPYQYLLEENLSSDFWTIRMVESSSNGKSNGHSNGYANGKRMSGNGKKRKH
ncbi:MAG TPA: C1 family peptidase [Terriglobales bacterium]|jgi:C1A family cysteine protease